MARRNLSVAQFKQLMAKIPAEVARELEAPLDAQAQTLAETMRAAAPQGETGQLRASIRVEPGKHRLQRRVVAGGELTTKEVRAGSGEPYDYSLGQEFGNEQAPAQPFFYPTWRLMRNRIRSRLARAVKPALAKVVKSDG